MIKEKILFFKSWQTRRIQLLSYPLKWSPDTSFPPAHDIYYHHINVLKVQLCPKTFWLKKCQWFSNVKWNKGKPFKLAFKASEIWCSYLFVHLSMYKPIPTLCSNRYDPLTASKQWHLLEILFPLARFLPIFYKST